MLTTPDVPNFNEPQLIMFQSVENTKTYKSRTRGLIFSNIIIFLTTFCLLAYGALIYLKEHDGLLINVITWLYGLFVGIQLVLMVLTIITACTSTITTHKGGMSTRKYIRVLDADIVNGTSILFSTLQYTISTFVLLAHKGVFFCEYKWTSTTKTHTSLLIFGLVSYIVHIGAIFINYLFKFLITAIAIEASRSMTRPPGDTPRAKTTPTEGIYYNNNGYQPVKNYDQNSNNLSNSGRSSNGSSMSENNNGMTMPMVSQKVSNTSSLTTGGTTNTTGVLKNGMNNNYREDCVVFI